MGDFIGFLFIAFIFFGVIGWISDAVNGSSSSNSSISSGGSSVNRSTPLSIVLKREKTEGFDTIGVYAIGTFNVLNQTHNIITNVIEMNQVTSSGKREPVICSLEGYTGEDSMFFHYVSKNNSIEAPGVFGFDSLSRVLVIPIDTLKFAESGNIDLEISLEVYGSFLGISPLLIATSTKRIDLVSNEQGYLEMLDQMNKVNNFTVELAAIMARIDGTADAAKKKAINTWIEKNNSSDTKRKELKTLANEVILSSMNKKTAADRAKSIILELKSITSPADRMNILNLLHSISVADGKRAHLEGSLIYAVVRHFEIDNDKYSSMLTQALPLDAQEDEPIDFDQILGISAKSGVSRQIEILKAQYKEWNKKVNSANPVEAKNARLILDYISKKRAELDA